MYEFMDATISIAGGVYAYLGGAGKVGRSKSNQDKHEQWLKKYGKVLKAIGLILVLFGAYQLSKLTVGV